MSIETFSSGAWPAVAPNHTLWPGLIIVVHQVVSTELTRVFEFGWPSGKRNDSGPGGFGHLGGECTNGACSRMDHDRLAFTNLTR